MKFLSYSLGSILLLLILAFLTVQPSYQQQFYRALDSDSDTDHSDLSENSDDNDPKNYAETAVANCPSGVCQLVGSLDVCSTSFVLNIGPTAEFKIQFNVDHQERELTLSLEAENSKSMTTQMTMTSQNTNYVRSGYSWEQKFAISGSDLNNRVLLISVKPLSQDSSSKVVLKVSQGCEDDGGMSAWLIVVLVLVPIALVAIVTISLICCIRRRRATRTQKAIKVTKGAGLDLQQPTDDGITMGKPSKNESPRTGENLDELFPEAADGIIMRKLSKNESPLTEENLDEHFPEAPLESFKNSFSETSCSICIEELKRNQLCRQLYCGHVFHSQCIQLWLINKLKKNEACCPNCNQGLMLVKGTPIQIEPKKTEEKIQIKDSYDLA